MSRPISYLQIDKLHKSFGKTTVLQGIELDVAEGEFIVLLGPSGCGKSTLLRIIAGLEEETSGDVRLKGESIAHLPPAKRGIAMVFQTYALYPHLTVYGNMALVLRQAKHSRDEVDRRVRANAKVLELDHLLERRPAELSGGQRQRVAIGRAIVREPLLFLFDEPLSNLDASLRGQIRTEIARLHIQTKSTMIYVTHDQVEAMTLADRIVVMKGGHIQQVGSPRELYERPANVFVAEFIGTPKMNMMRLQSYDHQTATATLQGGERLSWPPDSLLPPPQTATIGVRPPGLMVMKNSHHGSDQGSDQGSDSSGSVRGTSGLQAAVTLVEYLGDVSYVHARTQSGLALLVRTDPNEIYKPGQRITLALRPHAMSFFNANDQACFPV